MIIVRSVNIFAMISSPNKSEIQRMTDDSE